MFRQITCCSGSALTSHQGGENFELTQKNYAVQVVLTTSQKVIFSSRLFRGHAFLSLRGPCSLIDIFVVRKINVFGKVVSLFFLPLPKDTKDISVIFGIGNLLYVKRKFAKNYELQNGLPLFRS